EARTALATAGRPRSASSTPAEDISPPQVAAEPVAAAPPSASAEAQPARQHRGGSTTAIGIVLVVIGIFALAVALTGIDLRDSGWPLFIIIPVLTLMIAGFVSL